MDESVVVMEEEEDVEGEGEEDDEGRSAWGGMYTHCQPSPPQFPSLVSGALNCLTPAGAELSGAP